MKKRQTLNEPPTTNICLHISTSQAVMAPSATAIFSREKLCRLARQAEPKIQERRQRKEKADRLREEAARLQEEAYRVEFEEQDDEVEEDSDPLERDTALLMEMENCAKEGINECVWMCRHAAIKKGQMGVKHQFDNGFDNAHNDAINAKKFALMREILSQKLLCRLPGVRVTFGEELYIPPASSIYDYDYDRGDPDDLVYVDVHLDWGEEAQMATTSDSA